MTEEAAESALLLHACDAPGEHTLTLNQPRAFKARSDTMLDLLLNSVDRIANDAGARALVIASTGQAFCATPSAPSVRNMPVKQLRKCC